MYVPTLRGKLPMARSRSGTRNTRGPRKPPRRPDQAQGDSAVQTLDPSERGAVDIPNSITVKELAELLGVNAADVIRELIKSGIFASINQPLGRDTASLVTGELGYEVAEARAPEKVEGNGEVHKPPTTKEVLFEEDEPSLLQPRPPIVTVMGHVDHGKTSLLDAIRKTTVAAGERGGITQHIGASEAEHHGRRIVFLDTPGHEAFTAMRARGASVTDIAVLVVAADDGVMPQTLEALDHAKAANVPIVVAVNKVDKEDADPNRVRTQMVEHGIIPAEWGGEFEFVDVSAKAHQNLDSLLETLLVVADLEDLKGDPTGRARGTVLEAHLDKGRGPVATVLVQKGELSVGDALIAGTAYCRIRAMQDENGTAVETASLSKPVVILGWSHVPSAGDDFREVEDEREARHVAEEREAKSRQAEMVVARRAT